MDNKLVIGYLTSIDPTDKRTWSGTYYTMLKTLEKQSFTVIPLGPVKGSDFVFSLILKLDKIRKLFFKGSYDQTQSHLKSKYYAKVFSNKLKEHKVDFIFAPACSSEIANLKTDIPICYLSDTSFDQIYGFYREVYNYSDKTIQEISTIEKKAVRNARVLVYPTEWAAEFVVNSYHTRPEKVHVVKFGPNLASIPKKGEIGKNFTGTINLLLLGVNWEMKGGNLAFEAFKMLLERGYDVNFTVCGCVPPVTHEKMTVIPFLNKNNESDFVIFNQLLIDSHILVLPTRIDCAPIVFCEAAAFGIPVVTTDTGGVSCVIKEGITGYALPLDAKSEAYADRLQFLIDHPEKLSTMATDARQAFENELNWDNWGDKMKAIILANK